MISSGTNIGKIAALNQELECALAKIEYLEKHDQLTGLMRYPSLYKHVEHAIKNEPNNTFCIIFCGINNFNLINNALGYEFGNLVLQEISKRFSCFLQKKSYCSRKSGDEFIIFMPIKSNNVITKNVKKILNLINQPIYENYQDIYITASVGISRYPHDGQEVNELIENAKIAFEYAKRLGKNNYKYFAHQLGERSQIIKRLQRDIYQAFDKKEFFLCYQPQVNFNKQSIVGVEAVLRWQHPELGCIYPNDFIAILEETDLINKVGAWVLDEACRQLKEWLLFEPHLRLSVNLSAEQLLSNSMHGNKKSITQILEKSLIKNQLSPHNLEVEITENAFINDSIILRRIKNLQKLGVRIACDDFGVGYASFSRLKQLNLNTIKIDKSLVDGMHKNKIDLLIIKCVIDIAREMNIDVVAEGVKSSKQITTLRELGCDIVQGFYYSKPILPDKMSELLQASKD